MKTNGCVVLLLFALCLFSQPCASGTGAVFKPLPGRAENHPPRTSFVPASVSEIFHQHYLEEPLIPVGGEPSQAENEELAIALERYARRGQPDDFSSLVDFIREHPQSPWNVALLTDLGIEYYNTAHYSLALNAWAQAWQLGRHAQDTRGKAIADRAVGELAYMYSRLGRMKDLEALLKSVEGRVFVGPATERIDGAREGLWSMKTRPQTSFRCGPLALHQIKLAVDPQHAADDAVFESASTQQGFSLRQVAELSAKLGLNYQMAFRKPGGDFCVPAVVHWKLGHYAAMVKRDGDRYLVEDPTFGNSVWATRRALEEETSGYFLVPPGALPKDWRTVDAPEAQQVWGRGVTASSDPRPTGPGDPRSSPKPCKGLATPSVHLMLVNLHLDDEPVGYSPPVGPPVRFVVRYNHREAFQPAIFSYSNLGSKWTCDWISYITDNPQNPAADVNYYIRGGGTRVFSGYDPNTGAYLFQQMDHTQLVRTGPASYEMLWPDGSKFVFNQSDGSAGTSRKVFLTAISDPSGNAVSLTYDADLRLAAITDAIGQRTVLDYENPGDIYKITRVTDPFGRSAKFDYDESGRLTNITDVIGMNSSFRYETNSDFINALITPYGTTAFSRGETGGNRSRWLETVYPDGSRDRVEFNQNPGLGLVDADPQAIVPKGMPTYNAFLTARNTFYWSRTACATAYGDYTKARVYHWLHTADGSGTAGVLESSKEPLEGRVWYYYAGQQQVYLAGTNNLPATVGRVLDDGATQLYQYEHNGFGQVTRMVDPLGRSFSFLYATNGIDLLEVRMTRGGKSELLSQLTYNSQHQPLTVVDAAGQTTCYAYNPRGQRLWETNALGETTAYRYDANGYLIAVDGRLPGTNDGSTATYDTYGRPRTRTDVSGYTLTFEYDDLDRITRVTHPDGTFEQFTYDKLDVIVLRDRSGRQTVCEYSPLGQLLQRTDPLNRVTRFAWCTCGDLKSLIDPLGRVTTWDKDVQGRLSRKTYGDGSQVLYSYETTTSRLRQVTDESLQTQTFLYNRDNTLRSIGYGNAANPTPGVNYTYDPDYARVTSMTDGTGTTVYQYNPVTSPPTLGAGRPASIDGPLGDDTITFEYDELGRQVATAINGVATRVTFDPAGRLVSETNALGQCTFAYDGASARILSETFPNHQTTSRSYEDASGDHALQRLVSQVGTAPISEFIYSNDVPSHRLASWSQQFGGQPPDVYTFAYDQGDQLLSATVTNAGSPVNTFQYTYDAAGNRLSQGASGATVSATYNTLNQISLCSNCPANNRTNEWDGKHRLVAVNEGNQRVEFTYDGTSRLAAIRLLTNGIEASLRRFVWLGDQIAEERDANGTVTKRFFSEGVKLESGPDAGNYFYTRDHLGSIRELVDAAGKLRARYSYDPFGRREQIAGDLDADFGFAGMFRAREAGLEMARFRMYDAALGRWLSRDPLRRAELKQGPNLYAYVLNNPVNRVDPLGLSGSDSGQSCCQREKDRLDTFRGECLMDQAEALDTCRLAQEETPEIADEACHDAFQEASEKCKFWTEASKEAARDYLHCIQANHCQQRSCSPPPAGKPPDDEKVQARVWNQMAPGLAGAGGL